MSLSHRLVSVLVMSLLAAGCAGSDVQPPPAPDTSLEPAGDVVDWPEPADPTPRSRADEVPLPEAYRGTGTGDWRPTLPTPGGASAGDRALMQVGSTTIGTAELGDYVMRYLPDQAENALSQLMERELVALEAAREGVAANEDAVRRAAAAYVEGNRAAARVEFGDAVSFETLLRERYGRDLADYTRDAEALARSAHLRDRLVRLDQLRRPGVLVRALLVADETAALDVAERLRGGADMTALARRRGLRPPVLPAPLDPSVGALYERLATGSQGDVIGPLGFDGREGGVTRRYWQIVKILDVWEASSESWEALRNRIEATGGELRLGPVRPAEVELWRRRVVERHPIRRVSRGDD